MRIIGTLCLLCLIVFVKAKTIELNYQPKGVIVVFNFASLAIYTDTTAFFEVVDRYYNKDKTENRRVRNLILRQIKNTRNDTISFSGNYIPFNDSIDNIEWGMDGIIFQLTDENKLEIFDKTNQQVKLVTVRKERSGGIFSEYNRTVYREYINEETKKVLFCYLLHGKIELIVPRFY